MENCRNHVFHPDGSLTRFMTYPDELDITKQEYYRFKVIDREVERIDGERRYKDTGRYKFDLIYPKLLP